MGKFSKAFIFQYQYYNGFKKDYDGFNKFSLREQINGLKNFYYDIAQKQYGETYKNIKTEVNTMFETFYLDLIGHCVHFYINDPQLAEFLFNTDVKDLHFYEGLDLPFIKGAAAGVNMTTESGKKLLLDNYNNVSFCIHTTLEEHSPIYYLTTSDYNGKVYGGFQCIHQVENHNEFYSLPLDVEPERVIKILKQNDSNYMRLGINLLYYMRAFPECILDGIPKGERLEFSFKSKKQQIKTSDKLKITHDESGRVITPHLRRGHFRYLGSDFFKNKKGKTIFIEATAVKGHNNKTVIKHGGNNERY